MPTASKGLNMGGMGESILRLEEAIVHYNGAMESPEILFGKIIILMGVAVFLIYFVIRLRLPAIIGYLATGMLVGSHGFGLIDNPQSVESLTELGVVLLLFTIGLEIPIQSLAGMWRSALSGGALQTLFCSSIVFPVCLYFGFAWNTSLLFCFLCALSSTAVVLRLLQERGEMDSRHGQGTLGILIFQDFAVVPMMLCLPFIAGGAGGTTYRLAIGKTALLLAGLAVIVIIAVPKVLRFIAVTRSNELFLFTVVLICIGTAFLTAEAGLSLALGAFVSGLVIACSPYSLYAISMITPMRDIFTSLFFVSVGMRLNLTLLVENPLLTFMLAVAFMFMKMLTSYAAVRVSGLNRRGAILIAFTLCQAGEFSFVLAKVGGAMYLLSGN
ncbi:MAG: cation:proton antiporter, partial [Planctomycetes bacterium]|nr:cation:proton antiporter [Planctomycetota bacterium]